MALRFVNASILLRVKSLAAFVVVVASAFALMGVFGGTILALGKACQRFAEACANVPFVPALIGVAALAATLALARWAVIWAGSQKRR